MCICGHHSRACPYCWNEQEVATRLLKFYKLPPISWDMKTVKVICMLYTYIYTHTCISIWVSPLKFVLVVLSKCSFQLPPWNLLHIAAYSPSLLHICCGWGMGTHEAAVTCLSNDVSQNLSWGLILRNCMQRYGRKFGMGMSPTLYYARHPKPLGTARGNFILSLI